MLRFWTALIISTFASCTMAEDGRVFLKSDPTGAEIFISERNGTDDALKDTGKKTAALVALPEGRRVLILRLEGYEDAAATVMIDPAVIVKPDVIRLERKTRSVDVIFEDGWAVCDKDRKPLRDASGNPAATPCTLKLPTGVVEIVLIRDGFQDMRQTVKADTTSVEVTAKPVKGATASAVRVDPGIASFSFKEDMGCQVSAVKVGATVYTNRKYKWAYIPAEMNGTQFTQIVSQKTGPMTVRVTSSGKMFVLNVAGWDGTALNAQYLEKTGWVKSTASLESDGVTQEVWSKIVTERDEFTLPTQAILVGKSISRTK